VPGEFVERILYIFVTITDDMQFLAGADFLTRPVGGVCPLGVLFDFILLSGVCTIAILPTFVFPRVYNSWSNFIIYEPLKAQ
jgi:hypothetical protein